MESFSKISLKIEEIIDFLKRDLRLKEVYQEIICQKIINQAAEERSLSVTEEEVQVELDRIRYEKRFSQPSDLLAWLADQMTTLNSLEQRIREYLLAKKLAKNLFSSEVRELFAQYPSDFEQILLYRITVPYESLAQEIFYQIEEEEISFYEAAHLYDVDERRRLQCGYEGKQLRRKLSPELTERLFNANVGEVIGPLKSPKETYDLFLVEDFFAPELTREIYEDAIEQRFREWLEDELNLYFSSLEEP
jgi:parvulin-like peptidyl-prolyl isomerase